MSTWGKRIKCAALLGLNVVTLLVPAFLGAPLSIRERTIQTDIILYDARRVELRKYVITSSATFAPSLYNDMGSYRPRRQAAIQVAKQMMEEFRTRLLPDVGYINSRLRDVGPITR